MKAFTNYLLLVTLFIVVSCNKNNKSYLKKASQNNSSEFTADIKSYYFQVLDSAAYYIKKLDTLNTLQENQHNLIESRKWYKRAEPMLIAYDYENYLSLNAPNLLKIEMEDFTEIKRIKPKSYQVLEEYLFGDEEINNRELFRVYSFLQARIPFIKKNHMLYKQTDVHHLQMIRDAVVNVATKGITGFDSPMLVNSLQEAIYNYQSLAKVINFYKESFNNHILYDEWQQEIQRTISTLNSQNFDDFDRYSFIKNHTNYQLELINKTANDWNIKLNTSRVLNPTATNLFSKEFFNINKFSAPNSPRITPERIALGKALFNDTSLSKSQTMSCATCHKSEKAFTDGLAIALGTNGEKLQRNTPTLAYAVYQKSFFYDGRSGGLEDQIVNVTNNKNEFHIDLSVISNRVKNNQTYKTQFEKLYNGKISDFNIRHAIATYIRSLAPFNSKFDKNMQGLENTLTQAEKTGFNLFMGKAACATCHFPPTFLGTVPPKFSETEFENLGLTKTDDFDNLELDEDLGQYFPYKVEERKGFFKTSTVRNAELTAPYMHNGAFENLESILTFYNNGGGSGMGLEVPYQTLPSDSLNLNTQEIDAIISFIKTLNDENYDY